MNRRNFLSLFSAGVAGIALEQAIPLGRVWSFPKEIKIASFRGLTTEYWENWTDERGHHWYQRMINEQIATFLTTESHLKS